MSTRLVRDGSGRARASGLHHLDCAALGVGKRDAVPLGYER
jgi:hypothetical protein